MGQKAQLDITATNAGAVNAIREVDAALGKAAASGDAAAAKLTGSMKSVEAGAGKAGQGAAKLRGALSLLSPQAAGLAGVVNDAADAVEVLATVTGAAGLTMGPVAVAFALLAAEVTIVYGAYRSLTEEQDRNSASAKLLEAAHEKIAPLLAKQREAAISLRVARGELTEGEAASLRVGLDAQAQLREALAGTSAEIKRLHDQQGSVTASIGDMADGVRDLVPWFNPFAAAVDGFTTSTAEAEAQIATLTSGQATLIAGAKDAVTTINDSAKATDAAKVSTTAAAKAQRDAAEAARVLAAEYADLTKNAEAFVAGLAKLEAVGRAASESNLEGVEREQAARVSALESLRAQYTEEAELARGNFEKLAAVDQAYLTSREQVIAASEERIAAIKAKASEDEKARLEEGIATTRAAELAKANETIGAVQSAMGQAASILEEAAQAQADQVGNLQKTLAEGEEWMTDSQKKELAKRIDAQKGAARRAFEIAKAAKIAEALASTALAVINAISQSPPPSPFGLIGAGIAAAAGAASVAQIAGQEPSFHSGTAEVRRYTTAAPDEVRATLLEREAVLSRQGVANAGGRTAVEEMNAGRRNGREDRGRVNVNVYRHREFNEFIRDNIRLGGPLNTAITAGRRIGHRERSA